MPKTKTATKAELAALAATIERAQEIPASQVATDQHQEATSDPQTAETPQGAHVPTVAILAALDAAYAQIRATHPEVPANIAITLASGRGKSRGHFQGESWRNVTGEGQISGARHELNIASERLADGAEAVFTTLLHEAVHALAHATNQKDTSRQGRYHNDTFRTLAESFGLTCESDDRIGTRTVGLQSYASEHYAPSVARLAEALTTFRAADRDKAPKAKTTVRIQCGCGIPVTVPGKWFEAMEPVLSCDLCREDDGEGRFSIVSE